MDADDLFRLTDNPDFVPGIHNYCDRWCERCAFSMRCSVYAIEQEEWSDEESRDLNNQVFWDKLQGMMRLTMGMIQADAERLGIDLNDVTDEDKATFKEKRDSAKEHPCVQDATAYGLAVHNWLKDVQPSLEVKGRTLETEALLDLPDQDVEAEVLELKDILEIIQWYNFFIGVKLTRAASQSHEDDPDLAEHAHTDAAGSAKVALIGIDRSLAAWSQLRLHLPEEEETILNFLVQLDRLRKAVEQWLPHARTFIRPGLDDPIGRAR